jgi:hypothetical protein
MDPENHAPGDAADDRPGDQQVREYYTPADLGEPDDAPSGTHGDFHDRRELR